MELHNHIVFGEQSNYFIGVGDQRRTALHTFGRRRLCRRRDVLCKYMLLTT